MTRNNIVKKLIEEGFSEKTLVNMGDKQLGLLFERIVTTTKALKTNPELQAMAKSQDPNQPTIEVKERSDFKMKNSEIAEGEKWIQKAIHPSKKGSLKKALGVKKDETIPAGKLKAATNKGGKIGQRARLATTLKKLNKEEEGDVDEAARTLGNQNRKGSLDGMKYRAGRPKFAHQQEEGKTPGKSAVLAKNDVERKEIKEWVEKLVENDYHSVTTKNEIMELIQMKLQEQAPATAPPKTRPKVNPDANPTPETPRQNPNERPFIDPWKDPGQAPDAAPKFQDDIFGDETIDTDELPEFLKFSEILNMGGGAVNESKINKLSSIILDKLKKSAKKISGNGK
jgi:hypothetical protein